MAARLAVVAGLLVSLALPALASDDDVDLELVLAVDVSRSMDYDELALQREGYVKAFRHPEVIDAIAMGARGRIAVTYFEWSDAGYQRELVPWTMIAGRADAERFADALAAQSIARKAGTSISSSLFFAANRLNASPFHGDRRAIDVSGDGPNNGGLPVLVARDWFLRQGVTINGLPIMLKTVYAFGPFEMPHLDDYYRDCVIGGPGAFLVTVEDAASFEVAIRRKLVLEVAGLPPQVILAAAEPERPRADCLAGENARKAWIQSD